MAEPAQVIVGGVTYQLRPLNALEQFRLLRAIEPALQVAKGSAVPALALTGLDADDTRRFFTACKDSLRVQDEAGEWVALASAPDLAHVVDLALALMAAHFGPLIEMERPEIPARRSRRLTQPVDMPNGEDWLFRPVLRGMCSAESLLDGSLRIEHVALFNDILDCRDESEFRELEAQKDRNNG